MKNLTILQNNIKEREEEIRPCPLSQLTPIQETHISITFAHELNTLPVTSTTFLKTHNLLHTSRKQKQKQYPQERRGMNTKWVNGIKEGRTTKTKEKKNASDGGGDRKKTKRRIIAKVGINKDSEKPKNMDLVT